MEPRMYPLPPSPTPGDNGSRVDAAGLSHISQQLIASGFIARPLPSNAFSGSLDGQEAVMKCLWNMLTSRQEDIALRESMAAKQRTLTYDFSRLQTSFERADAAKTAAEKEASASASRASAAQTALSAEQSRHKATREDLTKARNAERAIKSQALYEARRKEQECVAIQRKFMKLTEAPSTMSTAPVQLLSAMTVAAPLSAAASGKARRGADPREGEVALLEASLAESERRRSDATEEIIALRKLVADCETDILKLVDEHLGGHASLAGGLPGDASTAEDDRIVTYPTFDPYSAPMATVTTRISTLLFALRDSASVVSASAAAVQARHEEELEKIASEWFVKEGEWRSEKVALEKELVASKESLEEAGKVIEGWVANGVPAASGTDTANVSADADSSLLRKAAIFSAKRKERNQAAAAVDSTTKAARARDQAEREQKRQRQVAAMLGELGGTPPVVKSATKEESRRKRSDEVREKDRRERAPRPSTESLVVEARPTKSQRSEEAAPAKESRRREEDSEARREREKERERLREARRQARSPPVAESAPQDPTSTEKDRPTSSSRPQTVVVPKPTSTSAHVASLLAAIMSEDTPPHPAPAVLSTKSPNHRRVAPSPLAVRHGETVSKKTARLTREEKGKAVERSGMVRSGSSGNVATARSRISTKENATVEASQVKKRTVISSPEMFGRRAGSATKERARA